MSNRRNTKVPAEHRRVLSIPLQTTVSPLKFLTLHDSINLLSDRFVLVNPVDLPLALNDQIILTDGGQAALGLPLVADDALVLSDDVALLEDLRLTATDSNQLTDSLEIGRELSVSDSLTSLLDSIEIGAARNISFTNDLNLLADSVEIEYGLAVADSFILTDELLLNKEHQLTLSDAFTLTDSVNTLLGISTLVADNFSLSDSLSLGYGLAANDSSSLSDSFVTFGQIFLSLEDSIFNWIEELFVIPQGIDFTVSRSDLLIQSDSIALFSDGYKSFADAIAQADAFSKLGNGLLAFSEQLSQTDTAVIVTDHRLSFAETVNNLTDVFSKQGDGQKSFAESINNLADAFSKQSTGAAVLADTLSQSDAFTMIEGERLAFAENANNLANGSVVRGSIWDVAVTNEQLTQSDTLALTVDSVLKQISASDSFTLSDAITTQRGPSRWRDAISVSTTSQSALTQSFSDSLPSMSDGFAQKFPRWRDAISVVKANTSTVPLTLADGPNSMSDAVSSARIQIAQPISDISVGLWSATSLFQKVDEFVFDDTDLIVSATNPANDTCEVGLRTTTTDPVSSSNHIVSYRYKKSASAGRQIDLTVRLMQGAAIIVTFTHTNISNVIVQADQTLSGAQADAITNYGDLRIRFIANAVGTGTGRAGQVTWAQFRCPK